MPTESTFLLAALLFVAAALGYFFARFGDEEEEQASSGSNQLNADYIKGLNFLLNEQPDQALEVFMRMVEVDDETLETHFALGSLFRRRGEFERAIRVHQNIIARPKLSDMHRDQAVISLADDYLSAGLFDRAEKLFQQLLQVPEHCDYALEKLIYIYEFTHDWQHGIELMQRHGKAQPDVETGVSRVAHYYCELAQEALDKQNLGKARDSLNKAIKKDTAAIRAVLALADLDQLEEAHKTAIKGFQTIMERRPSLIAEVIPKLAASCRALDNQTLLSQSLENLRSADPSIQQTIALAVIHDQHIVNETALECLRDYVIGNESLSQLVDMEGLESRDRAVRHAALNKVREGLRLLDSQRLRYQCKECGYSSSLLIWQCPSCRTWESVIPTAGAGIGR